MRFVTVPHADSVDWTTYFDFVHTFDAYREFQADAASIEDLTLIPVYDAWSHNRLGDPAISLEQLRGALFIEARGDRFQGTSYFDDVQQGSFDRAVIGEIAARSGEEVPDLS